MKTKEIEAVEAFLRCPYIRMNWQDFGKMTSLSSTEFGQWLDIHCKLENCSICRQVKNNTCQKEENTDKIVEK